MNKKIIYIFLALFVLSAALSYVGPISGDGCWHFFVGKFISENNQIPFDEPLGRELFWPPFLFHLVIALFYKVSDKLIFLILPLSYLGSLIFTYLIAKMDFDKKVAMMAVLFLGTTPLFLDFSANYYTGVFLTFFVLGSVYFAKKDKLFLSGLFFGLAAFAKLIGIFILPVLFYYMYKNKRIMKSWKFAFPALIGVIPYVRNYILFGNPVWPFLNNIFGGLRYGEEEALRGLSFNFNPFYIIKSMAYSFLGIPHGQVDYAMDMVRNTIGYDFSVIMFVVLIMELFAVAFILFYAFKYNWKSKIPYLIWFGSFIPFQIVYLMNEGFLFLRFMLPVFPVIAILFGAGFFNFLKVQKHYYRVAYSVVLILFAVFILTVSVKHVVGAHNWHQFEDDYNFIKENTPEDSLIYYNKQCLSIRVDRYTKPLPDDYSDIEPGSYIFFNEDYYVDPDASLRHTQQYYIQEETGCFEYYNNNETGTKLCLVGG